MKLLFMLEDDLDRIQRFQSVIAEHHADTEVVIHRTALDFIKAFQDLTEIPDLICLDHDLFTDSPEDPDPGDGRDVSKFLCGQPAECPTLIHSTNTIAAESMLYSMRDAGWTVARISPIGEDWIESYWYPTAREMISRGNNLKTS